MPNAFDAIAQEAAGSGSSPGAQAVAAAYKVHQSGGNASAYGTAAGSIGGAAACAATGVGAGAAPICGILGGAIGGFIGSTIGSLFGGGGESADAQALNRMQAAFRAARNAAFDATGETNTGNTALNTEFAGYANASGVARRMRYTATHPASTGGIDWYNGGTASDPTGAGNRRRQVVWWGASGVQATRGLDVARLVAGIGPTAEGLLSWEGTSAQTTDLANAIIAYIAKRPAQAEAINRARNAPGADRYGGQSPTGGSSPWLWVVVLLGGGAAAYHYRKPIKRALGW